MSDTPSLAGYLEAKRDLPPPKIRRAIRQGAGASLDMVAADFDPPISRHALRHWENGTRNPTPEHLVQYVSILRRLRDA